MTPGEPWILGVSYSHNGAACLLRGEELVVMVQEERLSGRKRARIEHHEESLAVRYCLDHARLSMAEVDVLAVCHFSGPAPPPLTRVRSDGLLPRRYVTLPHHLGHAYAVFSTSGFSDSAVLIVDGSGGTIEHLPAEERKAQALRRGVVPGMRRECEVASLYRASRTAPSQNLDAGVTLIEKHSGEFLVSWSPSLRGDGTTARSLCQFGSLGGMYSAVADLIFSDPLEAGKVMGLAPYGKPVLPVEAFFTIGEDGGFQYAPRLPREFQHLEPWPKNQTLFKDLAASTQAALEHAILYLAKRARRLSGLNRLCYAGGVALNSITNELLHSQLGFDDIYIMPAAEDSGPAIGAAYYGLWALRGQLASRRLVHDCLGRPYSAAELDAAVANTPHVELRPCDDVLDAAVDRLCRGEILGWFQGGSELGPRSLGQRSILCDPQLPDGKDRLNARVKHREGFRPFAPAVLLEEAHRWFELLPDFVDSPAMLRVCRFREGFADKVPAAAHIDGTGRLQTVTAEQNGRFYELLRRFFARTGVPILVNTSYNIAGEPIVETPEDALWCLLATQIDALVLEDRLIEKSAAYQKMPHALLSFYPRLIARKLRLSLPIKDGVLPFKLSADDHVEIETATPYGELTYELRATDTNLLRLCDGTRSGWQILEVLRAAELQAGPATMDEVGLARRLCYYRRGHLLSLGPTRARDRKGE